MTPKQREKLKAQRAARKARERIRIDKRKAKRAARAAPRKALREWSLYICRRKRCDVCGKGPRPLYDKNGALRCTKRGVVRLSKLDAHHLLPKERYPEFRYERMNGVCLCSSCHKFNKYSAHRNPIWFVEWLKKYEPRKYEWCKQHL